MNNAETLKELIIEYTKSLGKTEILIYIEAALFENNKYQPFYQVGKYFGINKLKLMNENLIKEFLDIAFFIENSYSIPDPISQVREYFGIDKLKSMNENLIKEFMDFINFIDQNIMYCNVYIEDVKNIEGKNNDL